MVNKNYPYEPIPEEDKEYFQNIIKKTIEESKDENEFIRKLKKKAFKIDSRAEEKLRKEYEDNKKKYKTIF